MSLYRKSALKAALCAVLAVSATPALADGRTPLKGVVELFTSQGCSSSPSADNALRELVEQGDVVALAYHVDYWNYLGWTDTFASKENTERQYAYAKMLGRNGVYTPQAILNGRDHINGSDIKGINAGLKAMAREGKGLTVPVTAHIQGDEIEIHIGAGSGKANVVAVYFGRKQVVKVEKGENSGKTIPYWQAVKYIETIGMWEGKEATFTLPASVFNSKKSSGFAVLLQTIQEPDMPAGIIGATVISRPAERETPFAVGSAR